jgi:hypothetical protein
MRLTIVDLLISQAMGGGTSVRRALLHEYKQK